MKTEIETKIRDNTAWVIMREDGMFFNGFSFREGKKGLFSFLMCDIFR